MSGSNVSAALKDFRPEEAWKPLPPDQFDNKAAIHLLRRLGFSARPEWVAEVQKAGPDKTVKAMLQRPEKLPLPRAIADLNNTQRYLQIRQSRSPEERQEIQRNLRRDNLQAMADYGVDWLTFARDEDNSPQEKMVMFLQDIFVVNLQKIRNAEALYNHQQLMRLYINRPYTDLVKAVSKSPAMIQFLDLNQNQKGKPNENFARELMELFTLGEGNYTEEDIKEVARAFTGYKGQGATFRIQRNQVDTGKKTIFGKKDDFTGDEVIDWIFEQPAALTFLPREFCKYYIAEEAIPDSYLRSLGYKWRLHQFRPMELARIALSSRLFYHPAFRGNLIKSPTQFYLGLLQELRLDLTPIPQTVGGALRNMGQPFYNPPNVRGWVGGKTWINSSTLAARRQTVQTLFNPINLDRLNADDYLAVMTADVNGRGNFWVTEDLIRQLAKMDSIQIAGHLTEHFIGADTPDSFKADLITFIDEAPSGGRNQRVRDALMTILQSPPYHLC